MNKRRVPTALVAGLAALALAACGDNSAGDGGDSSEDFPSDNINMVVSYAAGGPTDVAGRAVAAFMEQELDTTVVVENKDGGSGAVGTADVARSTADGHTIAMTTASAASRVPLIENVGYSLDELQPIGVATYGPGLILVDADSSYETIDDLIEAAEADPGQVKLGTAGARSPQHVELIRMERDYGVNIDPVPFEGEAPAVTALLGGNIDGCYCSNAQTTMAQVDNGAFKVLATGSAERLDDMPDVPTLAESGFETLIYGNSYFILVAPADIPVDALETLESALEAALEDDSVRDIIGEIRIPGEFMGADALEALMRDEQEVLGSILEELFAR